MVLLITAAGRKLRRGVMREIFWHHRNRQPQWRRVQGVSTRLCCFEKKVPGDKYGRGRGTRHEDVDTGLGVAGGEQVRTEVDKVGGGVRGEGAAVPDGDGLARVPPAAAGERDGGAGRQGSELRKVPGGPGRGGGDAPRPTAAARAGPSVRARVLQQRIRSGTAHHATNIQNIAKNAGFSNAETHYDHTTYYFKVASPAFNHTLVMFASMLLQPRFDAKRLVMEVGVVDQEFRDTLQDDAYRLDMVARVTGDAAHPYTAHFSGNNASLLHEGPGPLRQALLDLHRTAYSSHRMRLVVMGSGKPPDDANLQPPLASRSIQLSPSSAECRWCPATTPCTGLPSQPTRG